MSSWWEQACVLGLVYTDHRLGASMCYGTESYMGYLLELVCALALCTMLSARNWYVPFHHVHCWELIHALAPPTQAICWELVHVLAWMCILVTSGVLVCKLALCTMLSAINWYMYLHHVHWLSAGRWYMYWHGCVYWPPAGNWDMSSPSHQELECCTTTTDLHFLSSRRMFGLGTAIEMSHCLVDAVQRVACLSTRAHTHTHTHTRSYVLQPRVEFEWISSSVFVYLSSCVLFSLCGVVFWWGCWLELRVIAGVLSIDYQPCRLKDALELWSSTVFLLEVGARWEWWTSKHEAVRLVHWLPLLFTSLVHQSTVG